MLCTYKPVSHKATTLMAVFLLSLLSIIPLAKASLNPEHPGIAEKKYEIEVPERSITEKCFVTSRLEDTNYPDSKTETKLCSFNLYASKSTHKNNKRFYPCPKVNNTSIGIDLYKTPKSIDADEFQRSICPLSKLEKKQYKEKMGYPEKKAKFKLHSPGVSTGSILGYYHIANLFKALKVPAVVLRTLDINTLLDHSLAGRYLALKMKNRYLERFWDNETSFLIQTKHGPLSLLPTIYTSKERALGIVPTEFYNEIDRLTLYKTSLAYWNPRQLTSDRQQVFGALSANPQNEGTYIEASGTKEERRRVDQFRNSSVFYPGLKDSRPIEQVLASRDIRKVGQKMQGMEDTSTMLILDFLFDQSDRIGNIHYYRHHFFPDSHGVINNISEQEYKELLKKDTSSLTEKELEILAAIKADGTPLKVMLLKDNDGGFDLNMVKKHHLLVKINKDPENYTDWKDQGDLYQTATLVVHHLNPEVYKGLLKLYRWIFIDPLRKKKMDEFFLASLQFTEGEYRVFRNNLLSLYLALYRNCKAGQLHLDLDTRAYFSKQPKVLLTSTPGICEGNY